jgi:NAD(P)-dependent dehydrogenase (short-subunit alcohol dehydrogenase family)
MKKNNYSGALQQPLTSGFGATTTASEVINGIDLTGKTAIVTGGNTGLGLETTRVLAAAGAKVIVPARDIAKARQNLKDIPNVEIEPMNLMDPASIDAFAEKFLESGRALHLLINNAGIMWVPLQRDSRGIESQLATNYLGQFQLVARLWPALKQANGARVVNVSSYGHQFAPVYSADLNFEHREYETLVAYGQSKTASNLFALELDERAKAFGVRAYSLHPGAIYGTELGRNASAEIFKEMGYFSEDGSIRTEILEGLKTVPQGAATTVWCATSPMLDLIGGVYCEDCDIAELDSGSTEQGNGLGHAGVKGYSLDAQHAQQLWIWSEQVTGIPFSL